MKFTLGQLVVTPTGRIAKVMGTDCDGRQVLLYQDCHPHDASLTLFPDLLTPALEVAE